ncbi:hypothetical protein BTJ40_12915 [Microbulbifer sp. A4B17]|nr:hypothetical protein BTJ40_12915 [Microbulbifer sp. A4B17]
MDVMLPYFEELLQVVEFFLFYNTSIYLASRFLQLLIPRLFGVCPGLYYDPFRKSQYLIDPQHFLNSQADELLNDVEA